METENNLICYYLSDFSGCGYLRTIFPNDILNNLYGNQRKYEGFYMSRFLTEKNLLPKLKAIHFQRQINPYQVAYIKKLKEMRDEFPNELSYKLIYDLDDLFTEIPSYNIASTKFNTKDVISALIEIKNNVDIFTVSTYPLKKKMEEVGGTKGTCKFQIMPNYIPKYIYGGNIIKTKNIKPKIVWAGSNTHFSQTDSGDFSLIYDLIKNTTHEFDWIFLGIRKLPLWAQELEGKVTIGPWVSLYNFPQKLKDLNADFGIAPLLDNDFNRCKSNIKYLDYLSADLISICSDIKPYEEAKVFIKGNWQDDRQQILDIFNNEDLQEEIKKKQNRILSKYWLEENVSTEYMSLFELKY